jgi:hypothetical protein
MVERNRQSGGIMVQCLKAQIMKDDQVMYQKKIPIFAQIKRVLKPTGSLECVEVLRGGTQASEPGKTPNSQGITPLISKAA